MRGALDRLKAPLSILERRLMAGLIDVCEVAYDNDSWEAYFGALASAAPRYLQLFARTLGRGSGRADLHELASQDVEAAVRTFAELPQLTRPGPEHSAQLKDLTLQVVHGGPWPLRDGSRVNDRVAAYVRSSPRLAFWAGLDLTDAGAAVAEAARCTESLGATGLSLIPFLTASDVTDPRLDPLWRFASDRRLPVWVHCGQHFRSDWPVHLNRPLALDLVAGRFPGLVLVAGHAGWPWIDEMLAVAARHEHVYLELSSHRPSRLAEQGAGFAPLFSASHPAARRRVLFGSATWTQGQTPRALADELPGDDQLRQRWSHDNAAALLGMASP